MRPYLGIAIALFLSVTSNAFAENDSSATFNFGYLSGADSSRTKLGNPGYGLEFQTGSAGPWLRSDYGATLERATGSRGTLTSGSLFGGGSIAHRAGTRLTPFLGADAILGWGNYSGTASNSNGIVYGGMISAGAEFAILSGSSNRFALIIKSGYRQLSGTIGPLKGSDLNAVILGIGIAWNDGQGSFDSDF